jgi:ribokinase
MTYDFVAIGDPVVDCFIRLKEAEVKCDDNKENCMLSMRFGDKIPFENVWVVPAVGNAANAAVSAARLGLGAAFIGDIGGDAHGKEILQEFSDNKVATELIRAHADIKTNYHYVLWFDDDRTILIKHEEYPRKFPALDDPKWIYLSSLGEDSLPYHDEIAAWLESHPETKLVFQPGTFQMRFGVERLKRIYARTDLFFCNKEEAQRILDSKEEEPKKLMEMIQKLGPKNVVVTDGHAGAYALHEGSYWFMPIYPDPKPPLERTGAGDAFSSTVTAAIALGLPFEEALRWGPINSMSVVQEVGAHKGLLSREKLEEYLKNAPADYLPRKI